MTCSEGIPVGLSLHALTRAKRGLRQPHPGCTVRAVALSERDGREPITKRATRCLPNCVARRSRLVPGHLQTDPSTSPFTTRPVPEWRSTSANWQTSGTAPVSPIPRFRRSFISSARVGARFSTAPITRGRTRRAPDGAATRRSASQRLLPSRTVLRACLDQSSVRQNRFVTVRAASVKAGSLAQRDPFLPQHAAQFREHHQVARRRRAIGDPARQLPGSVHRRTTFLPTPHKIYG